MSEQINPPRRDEQETPASGLLLGVEPLAQSGVSYHASAGDGTDTDTDGSDTSDGSLTDTDSSDSLVDTDASDSDASDTDGSDSDSDSADADGTDLGDSEESESGLGGENPLGINRERVRNGDDKDTRDT
ncbi:MAG TPA: hypothetical protein VGV59_00510 [Pyrinomonadaceae bacterium]|nr:hypothetical protein [Pyrinomonadaceae bacterium]